MTPMPALERSWARQAVLAGFIGVLLGSSGAMAVLEQRVSVSPERQSLAPKPEPAVADMALKAVMAPLFDTAAFAAPAPSAAETSTPVGTESYSEDAAGVPSATYQEPANRRPAKN